MAWNFRKWSPIHRATLGVARSWLVESRMTDDATPACPPAHHVTSAATVRPISARPPITYYSLLCPTNQRTPSSLNASTVLRILGNAKYFPSARKLRWPLFTAGYLGCWSWNWNFATYSWLFPNRAAGGVRFLHRLKWNFIGFQMILAASKFVFCILCRKTKWGMQCP